jgi:hypothetical protein
MVLGLLNLNIFVMLKEEDLKIQIMTLQLLKFLIKISKK